MGLRLSSAGSSLAGQLVFITTILDVGWVGARGMGIKAKSQFSWPAWAEFSKRLFTLIAHIQQQA